MVRPHAPLLIAFALLAGACSPEAKAKEVLSDYENKVFKVCKDITAEEGLEPGTHYCSKVGSMALEMALEDTGLDPAAQKKTIDDWKAASPLGVYYADEKAREAIPDR